MAKGHKFKETIAYVRKPIEGAILYSGGKGEESVDEMLDKLDKQDIDAIKKEELKSRIRTRAAEAEQKRLELQGKGKVEPKERRFTVIDNKPVLDPEGEYTFSEALRTCAVTAGEKAGVGGDKVSEILGAIAPFVIRQEGVAKGAEEKKMETSVVVAAIEALKERGGGQQPLTFTDLITLFEKMNEINTARAAQQGQPPAQRTILDDFGQLGSAFKMFQELFGGGSRGEGPAPINITIPGTDGKGSMPLDTFMKFDEHRWERHKDEQKFNDSRENARVMRDFVGKLGKATTRLTPKEE